MIPGHVSYKVNISQQNPINFRCIYILNWSKWQSNKLNKLVKNLINHWNRRQTEFSFGNINKCHPNRVNFRFQTWRKEAVIWHFEMGGTSKGAKQRLATNVGNVVARIALRLFGEAVKLPNLQGMTVHCSAQIKFKKFHTCALIWQANIDFFLKNARFSWINFINQSINRNLIERVSTYFKLLERFEI